MTTPELSYDTVAVKSTEVRGLRGSVFRAALESEREFYVNMIDNGMTEERAFETLADMITKRNAATVGSFEPLR